jgi:hypothetical protein
MSNWSQRQEHGRMIDYLNSHCFSKGVNKSAKSDMLKHEIRILRCEAGCLIIVKLRALCE